MSSVHEKELFFLGIPTLIRHDLCSLCIQSALRGTWQPHLVYVIDNGGGFTFPDCRVRVISPPENLGVARSWNLLHKLTYPRPCVIANDDIEFSEDCLEGMLRSQGRFVAACGWSCYLAREEIWTKVGEYDERFMAYFEDNDYARRMMLVGEVESVPLFGHVKHHGSATLAGLPEVHRRTVQRYYESGEEYYKLKWGGVPGKEKYVIPFGGDKVSS